METLQHIVIHDRSMPLQAALEHWEGRRIAIAVMQRPAIDFRGCGVYTIVITHE